LKPFIKISANIVAIFSLKKGVEILIHRYSNARAVSPQNKTVSPKNLALLPQRKTTPLQLKETSPQ